MRTPCPRIALSLLTSIIAAASAHAQTWNDDFETYAAGSSLEGQGGWVGWDGVNTTNTVVTNAFAQSGTRSIQPNPGSDSVRQFTPPTTGTWVFRGFVYAPTAFASNLDYMVMNKYSHGGPYEWGSWITFNGTANTVACNCGGLNANVLPIPRNRWVEIRQVIDLDNNSAEIFFDGSLFASYIWTGGFSGSTGHLVGSIEALDLYATGVGAGMYVDRLELFQQATSVGTAYCVPAVPNTTGSAASITATGLVAVAANNLTLGASFMPANQFGFFLTSMTQGLVLNPGGSRGTLCLGGVIGRYVRPGQIKNAGAAGAFNLPLDLAMTPAGNVFVAISAGQTWNFQAWYRDIGPAGQPWSNFTNGVSVTFN